MQKRLILLRLLVVLAAGAVFAEQPSSSSTGTRLTSRIDTLQSSGSSLPAVNAASAAQPGNVGEPRGGMMEEHRAMSGMMMAACALFGLMLFVALALFIVLEVLWIKAWRQRLHRPTAA
jgi:hypothetical protein